jgi:hypothetical protein
MNEPKARKFICGSSPIMNTAFKKGCGLEYELPPKRKRRRGQRINPSRTTTCPECRHVDALYARPTDNVLKRTNNRTLMLQRELVEGFQKISDNNKEIAELSQGDEKIRAKARAKAYQEASYAVAKVIFVDPRNS